MADTGNHAATVGALRDMAVQASHRGRVYDLARVAHDAMCAARPAATTGEMVAAAAINLGIVVAAGQAAQAREGGPAIARDHWADFVAFVVRQHGGMA